MTAEAMGVAMDLDPQLAMPSRPRFLTELMMVPLNDGLLIEGTGEQQVLRGAAVQSMLPKLLPLLDGSRSMEQVAAALPQIPYRAIHNAVALLYTRGLLEDAAADPLQSPERLDPDLLGFLRRHVDTTHVNASGLEALQRLARSQAAVYTAGPGAAENAEHLAKLLQRGGVQRTSQVASAHDLRNVFPETANEGARLLVVLVEGDEDTAAIENLDEQCAALKVRWLRARVRSEAASAELGPFFERGETACYGCFAVANKENACLTYAEATHAPESSRLTARLWVDMLAAEALYILSRIGPMATRATVVRYDLETWEVQRIPVCRSPGCAACRGPHAGGQIVQAPAALAYEDAVAFPSRHLLDPKSHQVHYHVHNLELAHQTKRYPSAEQIALPEPRGLPIASRDALSCITGSSALLPAEVLDLPRLAALLMFSGGLDRQADYPGRKLRRWAPTGGNLGSVELYVVAQSVAGLVPSIYFYQAHDHALVRITRPMNWFEIRDFIKSAAPDDESEDALIVFAAAHHRVAQKYASFAYRVVQLDGGVALAQMKATAAGIGLRLRVAREWCEPAILDGLDLTPFAEIVTGIAHVKGARADLGGIQ